MLDRFEKALLFIAASIQAHAAVLATGPGSGKIPISTDIGDPGRVGGFVQDLLPVIASALGGSGASALSKALLGLLSSLHSAPAAPAGPPLPNPGAAKTTP